MYRRRSLRCSVRMPWWLRRPASRVNGTNGHHWRHRRRMDGADVAPAPDGLVIGAGGLPNTTLNSLSYPRFDLRCYGKEPGGRYDSDELSRIIDEQLFGSHDRVRGIIAVTQSAGPTQVGKDPDDQIGPSHCARTTC